MTNIVPEMRPDPMNALCKMAIGTKYEDLPDKVVVHAKHCILDTMAVITGGSAMEGISAIVDFVKEKGGMPQSVLPFYGGKVPASEAAFALGPMARAMDMGDAHQEGGHCSEYIIPALLAATGLKDSVSGKELITALVVGQEILVRIGIAFQLVSQGLVQGHHGGHYIFGCIASVGKLLDLSLEELENAEGIGRGMTQPHDMSMYTPPSLMVRVHHGFTCQDAINACLLAKRGISGPRGEFTDVLAGPTGYLSFYKWQTNPDILTKELGSRWEMLNLTMKPFPACMCTHTSIEGTLELMKEHNFKVRDIAFIDIDVSPIVWAAVCTPKEKCWKPQTIPECQFSLPYTVATAACNKAFFLDAYTPEAMARRDVRETMRKISAKEDPGLPPFAVRLNIGLLDGSKFSKEMTYVKGHPENPFTITDLIDKFRKCSLYSAYTLNDSLVDSITKTIQDLDNVNDVVGAILYPLTPK